MDRLLGHLAQFSSFFRQGELLCTQGLSYLLKDRERAFLEAVATATGHHVKPGLEWRAESRQTDGGRPDLEGRDADHIPRLKVEAKLGAPFGRGQLDSYVRALSASGHGGTLLVLVPEKRLREIAAGIIQSFQLQGPGPWLVTREAIGIPCAVMSWEDLFEALSVVQSEYFRHDLAQLIAMYRVFNGDDMEPITTDEQVLSWREREDWWRNLVDVVSRQLAEDTPKLLPTSRKATVSYFMRYVGPVVPNSETYYSIGVRDPFQNFQTPLWLRINRKTGHFAKIVEELERAGLRSNAVLSRGNLWFPLEVPRSATRDEMVTSLVDQAKRIVDVARSAACDAQRAQQSGDLRADSEGESRASPPPARAVTPPSA